MTRPRKTYREIFGPCAADADTCDRAGELERLTGISRLLLLQLVRGACAYAKLRDLELPEWQDLEDALADHVASGRICGSHAFGPKRP